MCVQGVHVTAWVLLKPSRGSSKRHIDFARASYDFLFSFNNSYWPFQLLRLTGQSHLHLAEDKQGMLEMQWFFSVFFCDVTPCWIQVHLW